MRTDETAASWSANSASNLNSNAWLWLKLSPTTGVKEIFLAGGFDNGNTLHRQKQTKSIAGLSAGPKNEEEKINTGKKTKQKLSLISHISYPSRNHSFLKS
jgi:hypothetical protein